MFYVCGDDCVGVCYDDCEPLLCVGDCVPLLCVYDGVRVLFVDVLA